LPSKDPGKRVADILGAIERINVYIAETGDVPLRRSP